MHSAVALHFSVKIMNLCLSTCDMEVYHLDYFKSNRAIWSTCRGAEPMSCFLRSYLCQSCCHQRTFSRLQMAGAAPIQGKLGPRRMEMTISAASFSPCRCVSSWNFELHDHFKSLVLATALFPSGEHSHRAQPVYVPPQGLEAAVWKGFWLAPPVNNSDIFCMTVLKMTFSLLYCQKKKKVDFFLDHRFQANLVIFVSASLLS